MPNRLLNVRVDKRDPRKENSLLIFTFELLLTDSLSTDSRPSVTSGLISESVPFALNDSNDAAKHSKASSSGEKHTDRSSEVQTSSDVFIKASSSSDGQTSGQVSFPYDCNIQIEWNDSNALHAVE